MLATHVYRQQHKALLELAGNMPENVAGLDEGEVRTLLFKFTGMLRAHLKLEDERLYPALLAHSSQEVRDMARRFQQEMGNLLPAYDSFYQTWSPQSAITNDAAGFLSSWKAIIGTLGLRIQREDNELYALADRTPNLAPV